MVETVQTMREYRKRYFPRATSAPPRPTDEDYMERIVETICERFRKNGGQPGGTDRRHDCE